MQVSVNCKFYGERALYHTFKGSHDEIIKAYKQQRKKGVAALAAWEKAPLIAKEWAVADAYHDFWD